MKGGEKMNMSPSIIHRRPTIEQFQHTNGNKATGTKPFRDFMTQLVSVSNYNQTELVKINPDSLTERLDQLTESEVAGLISWLEAKFDLSIEDEEQLVDLLATLKLSDLDEEDDLIQSLLISLDLPIDETSLFNPFVWLAQFNPSSNQSMQLTETNNGTDMQAALESLYYLTTQLDSFSQADAAQLLNLLKQMEELAQPLEAVLAMLPISEDDQEKLMVLSKVQQNFQNKLALAQKTIYLSNTTVTSKDVLKWVKASVNEFNQSEDQVSYRFGELFSQQTSDSTIEQLNIHLGQAGQTTEQLSDQLLTQFEKVISQSRFTQQLSGNNQLLLKLTPETLGTIRVELTEIDGEMLVKLTASSQMAKEALEANVRELRHMFAPQNIAIEKQEFQPTFIEQPPSQEERQNEQNFHDQDQQQGHSNQKEADDEAIRFEDVLFRERV